MVDRDERERESNIRGRDREVEKESNIIGREVERESQTSQGERWREGERSRISWEREVVRGREREVEYFEL